MKRNWRDLAALPWRVLFGLGISPHWIRALSRLKVSCVKLVSACINQASDVFVLLGLKANLIKKLDNGERLLEADGSPRNREACIVHAELANPSKLCDSLKNLRHDGAHGGGVLHPIASVRIWGWQHDLRAMFENSLPNVKVEARADEG